MAPLVILWCWNPLALWTQTPVSSYIFVQASSQHTSAGWARHRKLHSRTQSSLSPSNSQTQTQLHPPGSLLPYKHKCKEPWHFEEPSMCFPEWATLQGLRESWISTRHGPLRSMRSQTLQAQRHCSYGHIKRDTCLQDGARRSERDRTQPSAASCTNQLIYFSCRQ